jgi:hypothetical protein
MKLFFLVVVAFFAGEAFAFTAVQIQPGSKTLVSAGDTVEVSCSGSVEKSYYCYCEEVTTYTLLRRLERSGDREKSLKTYEHANYGGKGPALAKCEAEISKHPACL